MKNPHIEFSKIVIGAVMLTYFVAFALGVRIIVAGDSDKLPTFYGFVGSATSVAIGFYSWKAKNENVCKIGKTQDAEGDIGYGFKPETTDCDELEEDTDYSRRNSRGV